MDYREIAKLETTYLDTLPELVHPADGRLHTSFNQTVAAQDDCHRAIRISRTFRFGANSVATFVADSSRGRDGSFSSPTTRRSSCACSRTCPRPGIRRRVHVRWGHPPADGGDHLRRRRRRRDVRNALAREDDQLRHDLRAGCERALAAAPDLPRRSEGIHRDVLRRFGGVRAYLDSQVEYARENGYVETIFHRRRYIPELRDRNFNIRAFGERVAANAPIQGSAADLIKIAMIRIDDALRQRGLQGRMLLQVHDELVFEVPPEELEQLVTLVKHEMENAAELSVPLVVDIGIGDNWLDTKLG